MKKTHKRYWWINSIIQFLLIISSLVYLGILFFTFEDESLTQSTISINFINAYLLLAQSLVMFIIAILRFIKKHIGQGILLIILLILNIFYAYICFASFMIIAAFGISS